MLADDNCGIFGKKRELLHDVTQGPVGFARLIFNRIDLREIISLCYLGISLHIASEIK